MSRPVSVKRVVWTSFFVDLMDIVLNVTVAIVTGSVVMLAELLQAVADLISSVFLIIGISRPKKETFVWTISSALTMLLFASSMSIYFGYQRFIHPEPVENILVAYAALIFAAASNGYAFFISVRRIVGDRPLGKVLEYFNSSKLVMTKNTFVLDFMGMSSALTGLNALTLYLVTGNYRFDGIGAMSIGVILGLLSIKLITDLVGKKQQGTLENEA